MRAANTMAGKDAAGFENLKDQVTELSKTIPLTRDALANGLYQVISNGVPENNWIEYLNASARSAVGGIADVGEVVKVTSTVIKNYGLEWSAAQDIQDKIQLTAKNGVTSFEQLAAALPSVTGQAAQLGVSFTEMLAVMSTLTGVTGNTSEVATQLGSVLTALTKESSKAQKMAQAMGIEFNAASIKAAGGLQEFLIQLDQTITEYAQKTGELRESIYAKLFGRAEALRLTGALTGELAGKFAENIQQLEDSAGTMDEAFSQMASTGSSQIQMWKNAIAPVTDFIASVTKGISPVLTFGSQIGMTIASVAMLTSSMQKLNVASKATLLTTKLLGVQMFKAVQAVTLMMTGSRGAAIAVASLAVAMRALLISTGIGLVLWGISAAVDALTSSSENASEALEDQKRAQEMLNDAEAQGRSEAARLKVEIDKDTKSLKALMDAKQDTSAAIEELNRKYGQAFGVYDTASAWYDTLTSKSKIYCKQKAYEGQVLALSTKLAEKELQLQSNFDKRRKLWNEGKAQIHVDYEGTDENGNDISTHQTYDSQAYKDLKSEGAGLIKDIQALQSQIDTGQAKIDEFSKQLAASAAKGKGNVDMLTMSYKDLGDEITKQKEEVARLAGAQGMEKEAMAAAKKLQQMEARYKALGKKYGLSTGSTSSEKEPKYYEKPTNEAQYRKNVNYYTGKLTGEDNDEQRKILQNIALWQREIDLIELRKKKMQVPANLKSVDDVAKQLDYLTAKRKLDSAEDVKATDREIEAMKKLQKGFEMAARVDIDDNKIETYDELSKKQEYYTWLVNEGTAAQIRQGREGLAALDKIKQKLDEKYEFTIEPDLSNLRNIKDYDAAIQFYTSRQQKEDSDQIQKTQSIIDSLNKGKKALQLGIELPNMQREVSEIEALTGREYRIKVKGMGFEGLTDKIRELTKELDNPNLTDNQRKQLLALRGSYEEMRKDAVMTFSTLTEGWGNIRGIGSTIENITNTLEGNASAWQKITAVVDGFISLYESISGIVQIISMITAATNLSTGAKTAEAAATVATTTASGVEAGVQEAAATAKIPVIAANKAATASYLELAAAEYMAAHAYIPFAGFGIGAGFATAAATLVKSMGLMAFAEGGVISGPTLGLIGEYAGASTNPEVVAPLDKLRTMLKPEPSFDGKVKFEIQGRTLVGIMQKETNHMKRS